MSWKLCFPSVSIGWAPADSSTPTKRSFADKRVPKLEVGHEGQMPKELMSWLRQSKDAACPPPRPFIRAAMTFLA